MEKTEVGAFDSAEKPFTNVNKTKENTKSLKHPTIANFWGRGERTSSNFFKNFIFHTSFSAVIPNWNFEVALFYRNKHRNFFCGPRLSSRQCEIDCFSFPAVLKSPDFSTSFEIVFVAPSAGVQGKVQL